MIYVLPDKDIHQRDDVKGRRKPEPALYQKTVKIMIREPGLVGVKIIHTKAADNEKQLNAIDPDCQEVGQIDAAHVKPGIAMNGPGVYPKHTQCS
jgi:hypothetical protein